MICLSAATITSAVFPQKEMKIHMKTKRFFGEIELDPHKFDDTNGITIPITYPDRRSKKAQVAIPSEENVISAKEWVDYNIK